MFELISWLLDVSLMDVLNEEEKSDKSFESASECANGEDCLFS